MDTVLKQLTKNETVEMSLRKILLLSIGLALSVAGCAGIGPNATYYMATTSFNYDPAYNAYMVKLNGQEVGGGFGGGIVTSPIKLGPQTITWKDTNTGELHTVKNEVVITKEQLKGMKYLAAHIYPDDTVEITTSNLMPEPTGKGLNVLKSLKKK